MLVGNAKPAWASVTALLALGVFGATAGAVRYYDEIRLDHALVAVPLALVLALASLFLSRRARIEHKRTLGRVGSSGLIALSRFLGTVATLISVTAALSLAVFAVLLLVLD
ncbi:MAG: hypothetical protein ACRDON_04355 [Gaiellaceae bacterium]